jgi:basic amino acid/polyamine antiporter, APA family
MRKKYSRYTAVSVVVANMIGTGVFTSLGFQVMGITSGFTLVMLWLIGGVIALCGAFAYSELGVRLPRSGGEYNFLSEIYHPALGFLAGWISITVGFAAPVAAAAIAFGKYFSSSVGVLSLPFLSGRLTAPVIIAILLILALSLVHTVNKIIGAAFQNMMTILKVLFILVLIFLGFRYGTYTHIGFMPSGHAFREMVSPAFAISMFFVTYSYSGWNAAAYISGEIRNQEKSIPVSLITGTSVVILLYILLNVVFLYSVPVQELSGKLEVGFLFANKILGIKAGIIMGSIISLLLISSVSSMIIVGPRVYNAMGEDYSRLNWLSKKRNDAPVLAILFQSFLSIIFILTSTFEQVIVIIGFTLNLFTFMTVLGVFILRRKNPGYKLPYKNTGYPALPAIFLVLNLWILAYGFISKPHESLAGIGITLTGIIVYFLSGKKVRTGD